MFRYSDQYLLNLSLMDLGRGGLTHHQLTRRLKRLGLLQQRTQLTCCPCVSNSFDVPLSYSVTCEHF